MHTHMLHRHAQTYREGGPHGSAGGALARLVKALHGLLGGAGGQGAPPLLGGCQATPTHPCLTLHGSAGLSAL